MEPAIKTEPAKDSKEIKEPRKRDITSNWTQHLRSNLRRTECPECHDGIPDGNNFTVFRKHFATHHAKMLDEKASTEEQKTQYIRLLLKEATSQSGGDRCVSLSPYPPAEGL